MDRKTLFSLLLLLSFLECVLNGETAKIVASISLGGGMVTLEICLFRKVLNLTRHAEFWRYLVAQDIQRS